MSNSTAADNKIRSLAAQMGVTEGDLRAFIECLQVWTAKGYTFEQAVNRHMETMRRLIARAGDIAGNHDIQRATANEVWTTLRVVA